MCNIIHTSFNGHIKMLGSAYMHFHKPGKGKGYDAIGGSSGNTIRIDPANDLSATLLIHGVRFSDKLKLNLYISVKNLLDQEYYHPNIRRSGTEKFIQNGRYLTMRLTMKI